MPGILASFQALFRRAAIQRLTSRSHGLVYTDCNMPASAGRTSAAPLRRSKRQCVTSAGINTVANESAVDLSGLRGAVSKTTEVSTAKPKLSSERPTAAAKVATSNPARPAADTLGRAASPLSHPEQAGGHHTAEQPQQAKRRKTSKAAVAARASAGAPDTVPASEQSLRRRQKPKDAKSKMLAQEAAEDPAPAVMAAPTDAQQHGGASPDAKRKKAESADKACAESAQQPTQRKQKKAKASSKTAQAADEEAKPSTAEQILKPSQPDTSAAAATEEALEDKPKKARAKTAKQIRCRLSHGHWTIQGRASKNCFHPGV